MSDEDLNYKLFRIDAVRVASQVQQACAMATLCADQQRAFDTLHQVLNACLDQMCTYEATAMKKAHGMTDVDDLSSEDPTDGN